jgi:ureidoacrylate peracid hydrolase
MLPTGASIARCGAGELAVAPDGTASRDTWNTEIVPELAPESDDVVLYKHRFSGFYETDLDRVLKSRFIKESDFYWLHH